MLDVKWWKNPKYEMMHLPYPGDWGEMVVYCRFNHLNRRWQFALVHCFGNRFMLLGILEEGVLYPYQ